MAAGTQTDAYDDDVLVVDLATWRHPATGDRERIAAEVDANLRSAGFLLLSGHDIPADLAAATRAAAQDFFDLDVARKAPLESRVGGVGWLPFGVEANGYASGNPTPPDLKETFRALHPAWPQGAREVTAEVDNDANVWPAEVADLRIVMLEYMRRLWAVALDMFDIFSLALGLAPGALTAHASATVSSVNINRYPSLAEIGQVEPGQMRIGPHSDFGVLTVLDRQRGRGGLQVRRSDGAWVDAPWAPGTLAVNIGDLLAHWTGDAWKATFHRVLAPVVDEPAEELMSLVGFCGVDPVTRIETFDVPGAVPKEPVLAGDYMAMKLGEISLDDPHRA